MHEQAEPGGIHDPGEIDREHSVGYQITATESLQELQPRTLKHGNTFGLFDQYGDIVARPGGVEGLFHNDTRYLSSLQVLIEGRRPLLLSSTVQDNNAMLTVDLTNPDISAGNDLLLRKDTIHVLRSKFIWQGRCMERLRIQNFSDEVNRIGIEIRFDADFADLFEVRGHLRERRGTVRSEIVGNDSVIFRYVALDGVVSRTTVTLTPAPDRLERNGALYDLTLAPGDQRYLFVSCACGNADESPADAGFLGTYRTARRALRIGSSRAASVVTSNHILNETLCRSMADLYMLVTDTEDGPYPYAGTPWFSTVFGRDGIITAIQMLWLDPEIARGVLCFLARNQADAVDPASDAEPGKILHEMRAGEMARLREVPFARYYGSVDSTPLFVMLAGLYFERTGDMDTIRGLWPAIEAALRWIDTHGDIDGDGLIKYARKDAAACSTRVGRIPTIPSSTPTAAAPSCRLPYARCRAMAMPPGCMAPGWRGPLASPPAPSNSTA